MVILEGNKGRRWETLRMKISSVLKIPFGAIVVRQIEVVNLEKLVGDVLRKVKHSYTRVVEEEGQRKGVIISIRKWARVVICESGVGMQDWVDLGKIIAKKFNMIGMVSITPFLASKGLFFVDSTESAV